MPNSKFKNEDIVNFDRRLDQARDLYPVSYVSQITKDISIKNKNAS